MLKKLLIAFVVVVCAAFAGLQVWVASYHVSDQRKADQILHDTLLKVQARDTSSEDASKNGYADLKDTLQKETPDAMKAPYKALEEWSYPCKGRKEVDVLEAYGKNADKIDAAVKRFESILPTLDRALGKPNFMWASQGGKGEFEGLSPNYVQMRAIAGNLVAYSEYLAVTGKPARSLHYILGTLEFGSRVAQNGGILAYMIGVAIDAIALEGGFQILGRSPALTASDWRAALGRLDSLPFTPQTMLDRMDEEYLGQMTWVELLASNRGAMEDGGPHWPAWIPGLLDRDRKVLTNIYLLQRFGIEKLRLPSEDGIDIERVVLDSHSILAPLMVSNSGRAIAQVRFTLAKIEGMKVLCGLQLYRLEKGSYPETLDQLVPGVLKTIPHDYVSADGRFTYKKLGDDFQLTTTLNPTLQEALSTQGFSFRPPEPRK